MKDPQLTDIDYRFHREVRNVGDYVVRHAAWNPWWRALYRIPMIGPWFVIRYHARIAKDAAEPLIDAATDAAMAVIEPRMDAFTDAWVVAHPGASVKEYEGALDAWLADPQNGLTA